MLRTTNSVGPTAVYSLGYYDFKESVVETGAESKGLVVVGTVSDGSASEGSASDGSASDGSASDDSEMDSDEDTVVISGRKRKIKTETESSEEEP